MLLNLIFDIAKIMLFSTTSKSFLKWGALSPDKAPPENNPKKMKGG